MSGQQGLRETADLRVRNVGGIDRTSVSFSPGVTVLAGRNATNRTSLLQSVMAACGSDDVSVKGDADEAEVELTIGGETYTRTLSRRSGTIVSDGDPYLDDPELADLFAFLLESNQARRAVARADDLRELIMRPVDTEAIQAEIDRLTDQKREIEDELEELDRLRGRLPKLEERKTGLERQISEKRDELAAKEEELQSADVDVEESREEKAELESKLDTLRDRREALDDVRYELETERESLDSLRAERKELQSELDGVSETPEGELDHIESEIERLRNRKRTLDGEIDELQSIIQYNEQMLEGSHPPVADALVDDDEDRGSVTDQLLDEETVRCWTCGSEVDTDQMAATVEQLRELNRERLRELREIEDELEEQKARRNEIQEARRQRERLERRLSTVSDEIESRESRITELQDRRAELESEISTLEDDVESHEVESYSEILELHREANQLEFELGKLEGDLEDVREEIADVESALDRQDELEARREDVSDSLDDLRTRVEQIETQAIEEFNGHMDTILDRLDYGNLDRIWIERVEREVRDGRRKVEKSIFNLHVVRSTSSGTAYEDTIDHLSESEREVTGLVFALAGYLAHDVHEDVPFMLLDSLEAIDSNRIATLVEYFEEYPDYLVVALLPEDAAALDDRYRRVADI